MDTPGRSQVNGFCYRSWIKLFLLLFATLLSPNWDGIAWARCSAQVWPADTSPSLSVSSLPSLPRAPLPRAGLRSSATCWRQRVPRPQPPKPFFLRGDLGLCSCPFSPWYQAPACLFPEATVGPHRDWYLFPRWLPARALPLGVRAAFATEMTEATRKEVAAAVGGMNCSTSVSACSN